MGNAAGKRSNSFHFLCLQKPDFQSGFLLLGLHTVGDIRYGDKNLPALCRLYECGGYENIKHDSDTV